MTGISFSGVSAGYGSTTVLDGVDLDLEQGFTVLLGPNGCGKTTLFRVGAGILEPDSGTVRIGGTDPYADPSVKAAVSYLPHRPVLNPDLTVRENLQFWGRVQNLADERLADRIDRLAERFAFADLLEKHGDELSRGQAQRASIGQALLADPAVLFLDEATTGLDPSVAGEIRGHLDDLGNERTVVYSTHDLDEAERLADRLLIVHDGRIEFDGRMDEVRDRRSGPTRVGFATSDDEAPAVLADLGYDPDRDGQFLVVETDPGDDVGSIVARLAEHDVIVDEVRRMEGSIESIYEEVRAAQ